MKQQLSITEVALIQLRAAVQLYNKANFIGAITLAGAADELLGNISMKRTGRNSVEDEKVWVDQLADYIKKQRPALGKIVRSRNRIKNQLKHNDIGENINIQEDFQTEAETLICGAINNYELCTGKLPDDKIIKRFWTYITL